MYNHLKRKFACLQCGTPYEAYPPDDVHTKASSTECKECGQEHYDDKEIKVNYECDNCSKLNTIFWHEPIEHPRRQKITYNPDVFFKGDRYTGFR